MESSANTQPLRSSKFTSYDLINICLLAFIFWLGILRQIELPGLYMDGVNPDYLAAHVLNPGLNNPVWAVPSAIFPILGNMYHSVQNFYVDLVVFRFLGISVVSIRIAQAFFGGFIVIFLYLLTVCATRNRFAAFLGAALLATDIAFLASFRTQCYIILGGEMWLFASLFALWHGRPLTYFLSGVFFGFAIYGYFVMGFFAPAMALLVLTRPDRRLDLWASGFIVGMLPYVVGYVSLIVAVGGLHQALDWIRLTTHALAPLSSKLNMWESIQYIIRSAYLGLINSGNELLVFSQKTSGSWATVKAGLFVMITALGLALTPRFKIMLLAVLPISYLAVATFFGARLGVHHFTVLVPIAYLLIAVLLGILTSGRTATIIASMCAVPFLIGNLQQANDFHRLLNQTGGTRVTSNAITFLADEALTTKDTLYVFPEWGFFMQFALLTENRVPYILNTDQIATQRDGMSRAAIAFWSAASEPKYRKALELAGATQINMRPYLQRDGHPAFYLVEGALPTKPSPVDLTIEDWGPRLMKHGTLLNRQPDGGMGLWIKIRKVKVEDVGPISILVAGQSSAPGYLPPQGDSITASIRPDLISQPGHYEIAIKLMTSGKTTPVGYFDVMD